jgi:hypothetical protein
MTRYRHSSRVRWYDQPFVRRTVGAYLRAALAVGAVMGFFWGVAWTAEWVIR